MPSRWADERELLALCHAIMRARHGRLQGTLGTVLNNPFLLRLVAETGVPVTGIAPTRNDDVRRALSDFGYQVTPQVQIIPGSIRTGLHDPFYFAINMPGGAFSVPQLHDLFGPVVSLESKEDLLAHYRTPDFLDRFIADTNIDSWNAKYFPALRINKAPTRPDWEDRTVAEIAQSTGLTGAEVLYEVCVASDLIGRFTIHFGIQDPLMSLDQLRSTNGVGLGLHDAGAHLAQMAMGSWPGRLLGSFVRDGGLPLERAVQHATSLSAAQFGILHRGMLISGWPADIVVFDPDTIRDGPIEEVDDLPEGAARLISEPIGIEYVVVNGTIIRSHGKDAVDVEGPLPGLLLRDFEPNARPPVRHPIPQWIVDEVTREWDDRVAYVMQVTGGNPPPDPAQPGKSLIL